VTKRGRPDTRLMTETPRGHGMHHPVRPGTAYVLTSATRTWTSVAEPASTQATEPLEDRLREEEASTASSQRQRPRHRLPHSFASLATSRATVSYECPDRRTSTTARTPGSASRPAQTLHTADRGRLTHLTEKATKAAPNVAIGKHLSKSPSIGFG
jgi:hypothetical protein